MKKKFIQTVLGRYWRALETIDFVFYVNYQESDENATVKMYRHNGDLVSDNYFAYTALMEAVDNEDYTYASRTMKYNIAQHWKQRLEYAAYDGA